MRRLWFQERSQRDGKNKRERDAAYMDDMGQMLTELVTLTPAQDGALQWPGLAG